MGYQIRLKLSTSKSTTHLKRAFVSTLLEGYQSEPRCFAVVGFLSSPLLILSFAPRIHLLLAGHLDKKRALAGIEPETLHEGDLSFTHFAIFSSNGLHY